MYASKCDCIECLHFYFVPIFLLSMNFLHVFDSMDYGKDRPGARHAICLSATCACCLFWIKNDSLRVNKSLIRKRSRVSGNERL